MQISVSGMRELRAWAQAYTQRLRNLGPAFARAAVVVLTDAQGRIRENGPGWAPTAESGFGTSLQRTGALFRSLTMGGSGSLFAEIAGGVRVGTNLMTPDGRYNIGQLMQYGTGVYGPRGSPITPTTGKFLVFDLNGSKIFAKSVKGAPARPFLYIDHDTGVKVRSVFASYVRSGDAGG